MTNPIAQLAAVAHLATPEQLAEIRSRFNEAIQSVTDPDARAWGEIARAWICDRAKFADAVAAVAQETPEG
jgi:hypothetical protein